MENPSENSTSSSSDVWAGISVDAGCIVFDMEPVVPGSGLNKQGDGYESKIRADDLKRWYTSEKMHKHVVKILGWAGRWRGYQSLQIDPSDADFRAGVEVLHRRLAGTAFAAFVERFGSEAVEDAIICFMAFAPVAQGFGAEVLEKNRAAKRERQTEREHAKREEQTDGT